MTKIEMGKEYRTRDGRKVRIYAVDAGGRHPVHGAILCDNGLWKTHTWRDDGLLYADLSTSIDDLVEARLRFRLVRWVNVYREFSGELSTGGNYKSVKDAKNALAAPIARIKVIIEGEEGQFDD